MRKLRLSVAVFGAVVSLMLTGAVTPAHAAFDLYSHVADYSVNLNRTVHRQGSTGLVEAIADSGTGAVAYSYVNPRTGRAGVAAASQNTSHSTSAQALWTEHLSVLPSSSSDTIQPFELYLDGSISGPAHNPYLPPPAKVTLSVSIIKDNRLVWWDEIELTSDGSGMVRDFTEQRLAELELTPGEWNNFRIEMNLYTFARDGHISNFRHTATMFAPRLAGADYRSVNGFLEEQERPAWAEVPEPAALSLLLPALGLILGRRRG